MFPTGCRFATPTVLFLAVFVLGFAGVASAGETLIARVLDPFAMPTVVDIDPLDDNAETMAAVAVVKAALKQRGIAVRDDASHVLEIEVDPSARTPYLSDDMDRATANMDQERQRNNPVNQLSPSPELTPRGPELSQSRQRGVVPHLAVVLMLYKRKEPPGWMARAVAPRDSRPITEQVSALTDLAVSHLGKSAVIGFSKKKEDKP